MNALLELIGRLWSKPAFEATRPLSDILCVHTSLYVLGIEVGILICTYRTIYDLFTIPLLSSRSPLPAALDTLRPSLTAQPFEYLTTWLRQTGKPLSLASMCGIVPFSLATLELPGLASSFLWQRSSWPRSSSPHLDNHVQPRVPVPLSGFCELVFQADILFPQCLLLGSVHESWACPAAPY